MESSNPDLSSVLRTLSAFANPTSNPPPPPTPHHQHQQEKQPTQIHTSTSPPIHTKKNTLPNPSTITTYPSALKHIMHLTSQNQDFSARIQHLIKSQREHERTWWKAREALIEKQAAREAKRRRLEEVLKSVGASNTTSNTTTPEETIENVSQENATELKAYDSKVYQASVDMARAMETELRRLGVPFFCIERGLVSSTSEEMNEGKGLTEESKAKISENELQALKKRVLDLLVDLCS